MQRLDGFKRSLLQIDSCLIAEDDDHVALSVRVPKSAIRTNGELLAALVDHAGEGRRWAPRLLTRRGFQNVVALVAVLALGVLLGDLSDPSGAFANAEPITIEAAKYVSGPDQHGVITAALALDITQTCRRSVDATVLDQHGGTVLRWTVPATPRPLGRQNIVAYINLPEVPPPGEYTYRARMNSFCHDGESAVIIPDFTFRVGS